MAATAHGGVGAGGGQPRQVHFASMDEMRAELAAEERKVKDMVRHEFEEPWDANDPIQQRLHDHSGGIERVYGGQESTLPQELQLVQAWRPSEDGSWTLAQGVVHRVHNDDETVTVQFLPDQRRCRLPFMSVKPMLDITPEYPTIRLAPGERMPTKAEIEIREHNANLYRQREGIAWDAPLSAADMDHTHLRRGEHMGEDGKTPVVESDVWGISAPTLDALRNRSIPGAQVTNSYGQHFYTKLYRNNFYADPPKHFHPEGHPHLSRQEVMSHKPAGDNVVSHRYIPLHGPEMVQNLRTGRWSACKGAEGTSPMDRPGLLG